MRTNILTGTWNGTGAALYLCLGAIPKEIEMWDIEAGTNPNAILWREEFIQAATTYGGLYMTGSSGAYTKLTTAGVFPYEGGELLTSSNQTDLTYGGGVYLGWDLTDYRKDRTYGVASTTTDINAWALDTSANRTGHFNTAIVASGARIGVGSLIRIKENSSGMVKEAAITGVSNVGIVADDITLSRAIGAGSITFIGGLYDLAPIPIGKVTPAGIYLADTTMNVNDDTCSFRAEIQVER